MMSNVLEQMTAEEAADQRGTAGLERLLGIGLNDRPVTATAEETYRGLVLSIAGGASVDLAAAKQSILDARRTAVDLRDDVAYVRRRIDAARVMDRRRERNAEMEALYEQLKAATEKAERVSAEAAAEIARQKGRIEVENLAVREIAQKIAASRPGDHEIAEARRVLWATHDPSVDAELQPIIRERNTLVQWRNSSERGELMQQIEQWRSDAEKICEKIGSQPDSSDARAMQIKREHQAKLAEVLGRIADGEKRLRDRDNVRPRLDELEAMQNAVQQQWFVPDRLDWSKVPSFAAQTPQAAGSLW